MLHKERYRSGHNEAVLKTVWCNSHVGSNPTRSARKARKHYVCGLSYFVGFVLDYTTFLRF